MMAKTEKAHEYRNYFIACEKRLSLRQRVRIDPNFSEEAKAAETAVGLAIRVLNLTGSAQLGLVTAYFKEYAPGLLPQIPVYAIDAPTTDTAGSSKPTKSATALLEAYGIPLSANAFNVLISKQGYLEKQQRKSSAKKGVKEFWTVTEEGLKFGKNVTNPSNPRETQPHWYVEIFEDLLI